MKSYLLHSALLLLGLVITFQTFSQSGTWTWMHGSSTGGTGGNYGTKGVAAMSNEPPERYQTAYWTDKDGNFWIFGGVSALSDELNDMWKYDIATNIWTWVSGEKDNLNPAGIYGTKGIPSVNNYPSARGWGANSWTDNNGDLWLFGGFNGVIGNLGDLWKYHIATNEWTWMNGSSLGSPAVVYGTTGVPSPLNDPGGRSECKSSWVNYDNTLWMFGGISKDEINDLWQYDISINQWTFMKGDKLPNSSGNYGTKGIESATNLPAARASYTKWKGADGNFYIFAGKLGSLNDVWRYNPNNNNWTWLSGTNALFDSGKYIQHCNPSDNEIPAARFENQSVSTEGCAQVFWSFGGFGKLSAGSIYNDLWIYNVNTNSWTWVSGDQTINSLGNFGSIGVPSPSNMIEAKAGVGIWSDKQNNLWVFGGYTNLGGLLNCSNDLWRYTPDTACFKTSLTGGTAQFTISPTSTTIKEPVFQLNNTTVNSTNFEWYYNGDLFSTAPNPSFTTSGIGQYCFTLIVKNASGCIDSITHCAEVVESSFLFVPNAFSPNNDNLNNEVKIIAENIQLNVFSIFNRWGEIVFTTNDIKKGWNGTYKGQPCEIGTYFYKVEYHVGGKSKLAKGDITLLR